MAASRTGSSVLGVMLPKVVAIVAAKRAVPKVAPLSKERTKPIRVPLLGVIWVKKSNTVPLGGATTILLIVCALPPGSKIFLGCSQVAPPSVVREKKEGPL